MRRIALTLPSWMARSVAAAVPAVVATASRRWQTSNDPFAAVARAAASEWRGAGGAPPTTRSGNRRPQRQWQGGGQQRRSADLRPPVENTSPHRVRVTGLSADVRSDALWRHFREAGVEPSSVNVVRRQGLCQGTAFVTFANAADTDRALQAPTKFGANTLAFERAEPQFDPLLYQLRLSGLPTNMHPGELRKVLVAHFEAACGVRPRNLTLLWDQTTQRFSGVAFASFASPETFQKAQTAPLQLADGTTKITIAVVPPPPREEELAQCRICIMGLPKSASEVGVRNIFAAVHIVPANVKVVRDRATGECKGVAYATFRSDESVVKALTAPPNYEGTAIQLARARPPPSKKPQQGDRRVVLRGIPVDTTEAAVKQFWANGNVAYKRIVFCRSSDHFNGVVMIWPTTEKDAFRALALKGAVLNGVSVDVHEIARKVGNSFPASRRVPLRPSIRPVAAIVQSASGDAAVTSQRRRTVLQTTDPNAPIFPGAQQTLKEHVRMQRALFATLEAADAKLPCPDEKFRKSYDRVANAPSQRVMMNCLNNLCVAESHLRGTAIPKRFDTALQRLTAMREAMEALLAGAITEVRRLHCRRGVRFWLVSELRAKMTDCSPLEFARCMHATTAAVVGAERCPDDRFAALYRLLQETPADDVARFAKIWKARVEGDASGGTSTPPPVAVEKAASPQVADDLW